MKKVITVVVNTENEARFTRLGSDRAQSRIYTACASRKSLIRERHRSASVPSEDGGYLWRPYTYWRFRGGFRHSSLVERTNRSASITILCPHRRQDHPDTLASMEPDHCPAPLGSRLQISRRPGRSTLTSARRDCSSITNTV